MNFSKEKWKCLSDALEVLWNGFENSKFDTSFLDKRREEYKRILDEEIKESTYLSYYPMGVAMYNYKSDKDEEVWDKVINDSLEKIVENLKRKHEERMTKKLFEDNHVLHTGMNIGIDYGGGKDYSTESGNMRELKYLNRGGKVSSNTIVFDIDGVIAGRTTDGDYSKAEPLTYGIEQVNRVYDEGYHVILYTARYGDRERGNVNRQYNRGYVELINWLDKHSVKRHEVYMGKPAAMLYVDDKASRVFKDDEEGWEVFWADVDELSRRDKYGNYILEDELEDEENDVPVEVVVVKSFWQKLKDWFNG